MTRLLWVCVAGALGTGARYLLAVWLLRLLGPAFPWGTLAVNALGSFLLGVIMHVGLTTDMLSPTVRITLATGLMGGFTTYSTFNYETLQYMQEGAWTMAALNVGATVVLCLVMGVLGVGAARLVTQT